MLYKRLLTAFSLQLIVNTRLLAPVTNLLFHFLLRHRDTRGRTYSWKMSDLQRGYDSILVNIGCVAKVLGKIIL